MTGENERFRQTLRGRCDEGTAWRCGSRPARTAYLGLAANVGSRGRLRAVGVQCGLIGGDCGFEPPLIGEECEPKTSLVCEPIAHCLRAATARMGHGRGQAILDPK